MEPLAGHLSTGARDNFIDALTMPRSLRWRSVLGRGIGSSVAPVIGRVTGSFGANDWHRIRLVVAAIERQQAEEPAHERTKERWRWGRRQMWEIEHVLLVRELLLLLVVRVGVADDHNWLQRGLDSALEGGLAGRRRGFETQQKGGVILAGQRQCRRSTQEVVFTLWRKDRGALERDLQGR